MLGVIDITSASVWDVLKAKGGYLIEIYRSVITDSATDAPTWGPIAPRHPSFGRPSHRKP